MGAKQSERILMVCLGNICRSPMAEGIAKSLAEKNGLDWYIDSAGTGAYHVGQSPDARSIVEAAKHGIDITDLRARQFTPEDFDNFDRIYAMDEENYNMITLLSHTPEQRAKVTMILNEVNPGSNLSVPDPYWDDNGFGYVFDLLSEAIEHIVQQAVRQKSE